MLPHQHGFAPRNVTDTQYKNVVTLGLKRTMVLSLLALAVIVTNSCGLVKAGFARIHTDFEELDRDSRVLYETASRDLALQVAHELDGNISDIEEFFTLKFREPIEILVFSMRDNFASYCNTSTKPRAVTIGTTICISPRIETMIDTVPAILKHELTHALLRQHLGFWKHEADLPTWFREGIAVTASGGGGAEKISPDVARKAILTNHTFQPSDSGSLFFRRYASAHNLQPHMFYRQSGMFVEFLKEQGTAFNVFLMLLKHERFKTAFEQSFHRSVRAMWQTFVSQLMRSGHTDHVSPMQLELLS